MPYFSEDPETLAFEKLMRRVPNFEPDPPETAVIQWALDRNRGLRQENEKRKQGKKE